MKLSDMTDEQLLAAYHALRNRKGPQTQQEAATIKAAIEQYAAELNRRGL